MTDDAVNDHITRMGFNDLRHTDAATQATAGILKQLLRTVEIAMEDEGVDPEVIRRVMRLTIYGSMPNRHDITEKAALRRGVSNVWAWRVAAPSGWSLLRKR